MGRMPQHARAERIKAAAERRAGREIGPRRQVWQRRAAAVTIGAAITGRD